MFQSNVIEPNYSLIPELREFVYRLLADIRKEAISKNQSLFNKVLIEPSENTQNLGDINQNKLTAAFGTETIPADTLITFEFDKSSQDSWGIEDQDISSTQTALAVSTYFAIRTKKSLGKTAYVEYLVKYIKDNLVKNDCVYSNILLKTDGWTGATYSTNCFSNYDTKLQSPTLMSDPDTNWYKYNFHLILNIFIKKP